MNENSKSPEEAKELTPEELDGVAGGISGGSTDDKHKDWIEINSFQWGGSGQ